MVDPRDLGLVSQVRSPHAEAPTIYLYEAVPGGVGLSERLWERHDELLAGGRGPHRGLRLRAGCPACTGPRLEPEVDARALALRLLGELGRDAGSRSPTAPRMTPAGDRRRRRSPVGSTATGRDGDARAARTAAAELVPAPGRGHVLAERLAARGRRRGRARAEGAVVRCEVPAAVDPGRSRPARDAARASRRRSVPLVCLDTETTGLATAAGTVAFLIGLGWWEGDRFRQVQLLLPDHGDEPALLAALAAHIPPDGWLVTYNGRGFDWPLLVARYRLARLDPPRSTPATWTCCRSSGACSAIGWPTPGCGPPRRSCSGCTATATSTAGRSRAATSGSCAAVRPSRSSTSSATTTRTSARWPACSCSLETGYATPRPRGGPRRPATWPASPGRSRGRAGSTRRWAASTPPWRRARAGPGALAGAARRVDRRRASRPGRRRRGAVVVAARPGGLRRLGPAPRREPRRRPRRPPSRRRGRASGSPSSGRTAPPARPLGRGRRRLDGAGCGSGADRGGGRDRARQDPRHRLRDPRGALHAAADALEMIQRPGEAGRPEPRLRGGPAGLAAVASDVALGGTGRAPARAGHGHAGAHYPPRCDPESLADPMR